jgi:hypothetical protein
MRTVHAWELRGACGVGDRFRAHIAAVNSSDENFREARYAHSLGDHHRFYRRYHRAAPGAWTKQFSSGRRSAGIGSIRAQA